MSEAGGHQGVPLGASGGTGGWWCPKMATAAGIGAARRGPPSCKAARGGPGGAPGRPRERTRRREVGSARAREAADPRAASWTPASPLEARSRGGAEWPAAGSARSEQQPLAGRAHSPGRGGRTGGRTGDAETAGGAAATSVCLCPAGRAERSGAERLLQPSGPGPCRGKTPASPPPTASSKVPSRAGPGRAGPSFPRPSLRERARGLRGADREAGIPAASGVFCYTRARSGWAQRMGGSRSGGAGWQAGGHVSPVPPPRLLDLPLIYCPGRSALEFADSCRSQLRADPLLCAPSRNPLEGRIPIVAHSSSPS